MAADIFTKSFSNPCAWSAACWLVCVVNEGEVNQRCFLGDALPPSSQGGGKRGEWNLSPNGSGTWTRYDRSAVRCRTLYRSGPSRHEVHTRETFDADTGELLDTTREFATAKVIDQELPSPKPRALRSVFHFDATNAVVPQEVPDPELVPAQTVVVDDDVSNVGVSLPSGHGPLSCPSVRKSRLSRAARRAIRARHDREENGVTSP